MKTNKGAFAAPDKVLFMRVHKHLVLGCWYCVEYNGRFITSLQFFREYGDWMADHKELVEEWKNLV